VNLLRRLWYSPNAALGLCSTCSWGTVRAGHFPGLAETFCRLVGPNSRVHFAVRHCTDYADRRVSLPPPDGRSYGFVTSIHLADGGEVRLETPDAAETPAGSDKP